MASKVEPGCEPKCVQLKIPCLFTASFGQVDVWTLISFPAPLTCLHTDPKNPNHIVNNILICSFSFESYCWERRSYRSLREERKWMSALSLLRAFTQISILRDIRSSIHLSLSIPISHRAITHENICFKSSLSFLYDDIKLHRLTSPIIFILLCHTSNLIFFPWVLLRDIYAQFSKKKKIHDTLSNL